MNISRIAIVQEFRQTWRDYYQLTKPKVVALLLLTAWVGMWLAPTTESQPELMLIALTGIGLLSAAAAALNHVLDQNIDAKMARTQRRPVATGRVSPQQALAFAVSLAIAGFALLYEFVNPLTAWLTLASLFGYAGVYTMFLKRATPQNIVIGGLAGAMPPLLGWTSITGTLSAEPWLLVMIIFAWTPPHFWALAIHRRDDYAKVNMPMLPVTHGIEFTKTAILLYTLLLTLVCLMPYLVGMSGLVYLIGSLGLNLGFMLHAWRLKFGTDPKQAMQTFRFSIYHLMLLFLVLILDQQWFWRWH
ncbi:MAG: protoheme IX farnesyltransferase [Rheinheimera sp.]|nr:MAG: protoheme IX farnesyltransferase [Rheinheimera sp.]